MKHLTQYLETLDAIYPANFDKAKTTYRDAIESTQEDIDNPEKAKDLAYLEEELGDYQAGLVFVQHQEFYYEQQTFKQFADEKIKALLEEGKYDKKTIEALCKVMNTPEYKDFTTLTLKLVEDYGMLIQTQAKESYVASYGRKN